MDQCVHEIREQNWIEIVNAAHTSGQSIKDFCTTHGIDRRRFYYHQAKIRKQAYAQLVSQGALVPAGSAKIAERTAFVQVPVASPPQPLCTFQPTAVLCAGAITVGLSEGVSEEFLMKLGKMIRHAL